MPECLCKAVKERRCLQNGVLLSRQLELAKAQLRTITQDKLSRQGSKEHADMRRDKGMMPNFVLEQ